MKRDNQNYYYPYTPPPPPPPPGYCTGIQPSEIQACPACQISCRNRDYWRSTYWPEGTYYNRFSCSSQTWWELVNKYSPNCWESLAIQYIVANLNIQAGATQTYSVQTTMYYSQQLLSCCSWSRTQQYTAQNYQATLSDFNSGSSVYGMQSSNTIQAVADPDPDPEKPQPATTPSFLIIVIPACIGVFLIGLGLIIYFVKPRLQKKSGEGNVVNT
jgi:hypothetical protein